RFKLRTARQGRGERFDLPAIRRRLGGEAHVANGRIPCHHGGEIDLERTRDRRFRQIKKCFLECRKAICQREAGTVTGADRLVETNLSAVERQGETWLSTEVYVPATFRMIGIVQRPAFEAKRV